MSLLQHQLSDATLSLIEQAIYVLGGRLTIYASGHWAVEFAEQRLAFDPNDDTPHLRDELVHVVEHGHFR